MRIPNSGGGPPFGPGLAKGGVVPRTIHILSNEDMSPLFLATIEATEEAIYDSLFKATTTTANGHTVSALPLDKTVETLKKYGVVKK
jgi:D-aminopeptidase